jgi:hypothetical protein
MHCLLSWGQSGTGSDGIPCHHMTVRHCLGSAHSTRIACMRLSGTGREGCGGNLSMLGCQRRHILLCMREPRRGAWWHDVNATAWVCDTHADPMLHAACLRHAVQAQSYRYSGQQAACTCMQPSDEVHDSIHNLMVLGMHPLSHCPEHGSPRVSQQRNTRACLEVPHSSQSAVPHLVETALTRPVLALMNRAPGLLVAASELAHDA